MADEDQEVQEAQEAPPRVRIAKAKLLLIVGAASLGIVFLSALATAAYGLRRAHVAEAEIVALEKTLQQLREDHDTLQEQVQTLSQVSATLKAQLAAARAAAETPPRKPDSDMPASVPVPVSAPASASHRETAPAAGSKGTADVVAEKPVAAADTAPVSAGGATPPAAAAPVPAAARSGRAAADAFRCDLVGKSPEEQAATLKRCVGVMDAPPPRAAPRQR